MVHLIFSHGIIRFPFFVEETSSADIYSLDNGKLFLVLKMLQIDYGIFQYQLVVQFCNCCNTF